eukprot:c11042_g2_i1.p1 GENE.c11042_g2_i1~~c11042_g2_i1.p1  ORF type:complete len:872 (-),score=166.54 c11042_g2_i1:249-2864(-)
MEPPSFLDHMSNTNQHLATAFFHPQHSAITRSITRTPTSSLAALRTAHHLEGFSTPTTFRDGNFVFAHREINQQNRFPFSQTPECFVGASSSHCTKSQGRFGFPQSSPFSVDESKFQNEISMEFCSEPVSQGSHSDSHSLCLLRSLIASFPAVVLENVEEGASAQSTQRTRTTIVTPPQATFPCTSQQFGSGVTFENEPRTHLKRLHSQAQLSIEMETTKKRCPSPLAPAESESPTRFVKLEPSPNLLQDSFMSATSSSTTSQHCETSQDILTVVEQKISTFFQNVTICAQQHLSTSQLLQVVAISPEASPRARHILAELDQTIQKSVTPPSDVHQLSAALISRCTPDSVHDTLVLHTLEELKFVFTNSFHDGDSNTATAATTTAAATHVPCERGCWGNTYRLMITMLFVMICRLDRTISLLDHPEHRLLRNWAMSVFFKSMLCPASMLPPFPDPALLGKIGLAKLDAKQKKIPREVVEVVLRPALQHFCQLKKLDLKLIVGLRSVVELFPTLFKEVFGKRILETLESLADPKTLNETFPGAAPRDIRAMLIHMLDFFQLFASTNAFSCDQWLGKITEVVAKFEEQFPPLSNAPTTNNYNAPRAACCGFRAPLCRLLCLYPAKAVDMMLQQSSTQPTNQHKLCDLFRSVMKCKHAFPLCEEFKSRSTNLSCPGVRSGLGQFVGNNILSDVTILVGPTKAAFKAHRIILASKSLFFHHLFTNGFAETSRNEISLAEVNEDSFRLVLRHLYGDLTNLTGVAAQTVFDTYREADKFGLVDLQVMCEHQLAALVDASNWRPLLELAVASVSLCLPAGSSLSTLLCVDNCGDIGGETLLRACKAFILANLHSLTDEIKEPDAIISDLLSSTPGLSF